MYKALIVDDEDLIREAVRILGRWSDFSIQTILEATNAKMALEIIQKEAPDIIITDMKMPVMDGVELLRELKLMELNSKVIVVSGFADFEYTRQAIRSNVVDYILKPIDSQELNNAIAAAIGQIEEESSLTDISQEDVSGSIGSNIISEIEKYVCENFYKEITLDELAHKFYVSKEHISRSFKKQFDMNLFDYITILRIEKAKTLLMKTQHSIEEIALKAGFSNGNYFSKAFRKHTNISPSEYRNNIKNSKYPSTKT